MQTNLVDKIRITQGHLTVAFDISESFPLHGGLVEFTNRSINANTFSWDLSNGIENTNITTKDAEIEISEYGDLAQTLSETNTIDSKSLTKYVYPLKIDEKAYAKFT